MSRIAEAARRAVLGLSPEGSGEVTRAVVEVIAEGRTELVSVVLLDGELRCVASDGRTAGAHVVAALRLLAGEGEGVVDGEGSRRFGGGPKAARDSSAGAVRAEEPGKEAKPKPQALAEALLDVLTATVRVGVDDARGSPSVTSSLDRMRAACPDPLPLGVSRWIGRFHAALSDSAPLRVAELLEGASLLADDLRAERPGADARRRVVAWLGGHRHTDVEVLHERTLLEVGREWLAGLSRSGIERRYLVDVDDGTVYREERARGGQASIGPCPRLLSVGLGEAEIGPEPRRLHLLQYVVTNDVDSEVWAKVAASATRRFGPLTERYGRSLATFPGLVEPFALVAPARIEQDDDAAVPLDDEGAALPLARGDDPIGAAALSELARARDVDWIAGRLVDHAGQLLVVPISAATRRDGRTALERIR